MRIASLSPSVTEILFALDMQDHIVCTDQFSNFPEDVQQIAHVRDHMNIKAVDLQEYDVDLIFTSTVIQKCLSAELIAEQYSVVHYDPRTIVELYDSIRSLGILLQKEKESAALILSMQQGFNDVKKKAGLLPKRPKLYVEEWYNPPMASGNWVPEICHYAGGTQLPIAPGELSAKVTLQEVQQHDPDMIVLSVCGAGSHVDPALLTERGGWDELRAVQVGNVRVIDDSLLNRHGPRLVEGAQRLYGWMFEMLH